MATHRFYKATLCCLFALSLAALGQQAAPANKWEAEIKKFEEADRQSAPPKNAVLFIGSSSIRIWKDLAADFPNVKVINRGFGGSQIADSTRYVDRIVTPYKPRMVVLYAGDNDLAAGKTPEQVFDDYKAFVARVRQGVPSARIAFISIKPSPSRASLLDAMRQVNAMVKDYAARNKNLVYIDVFTPMLQPDGQARGELFGPDNLHMNRSGYELWRGIVAPYLR
jgi:lysophospholipase L1-like esterase